MSQINRKQVYFVQGRTIQEFKNGKKRIHFTKCSKSYIVLTQTFSLQNLNRKLPYSTTNISLRWSVLTYAPPHDKTNKVAYAPSEDSAQHGHPPSLIRVFAVHMKNHWVISYPLNAQRRLWSDWADAQADLRLHWEHMSFVGFVIRRLIYNTTVNLAMYKARRMAHRVKSKGFPTVFHYCLWNNCRSLNSVESTKNTYFILNRLVPSPQFCRHYYKFLWAGRRTNTFMQLFFENYNWKRRND